MTRTSGLMGCFPLYPPLELFDSLGLTPVVLWGDRRLTRTPRSDARVQTYACSVARRLTEEVLAEESDFEALFMYNACDTLRNLPEILETALAEQDRAMEVIKLHVPAGNLTGYHGREFLRRELAALIARLEQSFGVTFSPEAFAQSVDQYRALRSLVLEGQRLAAAGALPFSDLCATLDSTATLPVREQIAAWQALHDRAGAPSPAGIPVMVSGILAPPPEVCRALTDSGLRIVANDLAQLHRAHAYTPAARDDVTSYYHDFYANHFPCPTLLPSAQRREVALLDLIQSSKARGVIWLGEKFCEYEYFEFPFLERRFSERGIPTLRLELALGDETVNATRLRAFAELLEKQGGE